MRFRVSSPHDVNAGIPNAAAPATSSPMRLRAERREILLPFSVFIISSFILTKHFLLRPSQPYVCTPAEMPDKLHRPAPAQPPVSQIECFHTHACFWLVF